MRMGMRTIRVVVMLSVLLLLCAQADAQERSWTFDKVGRGSTSSIAVDAGQSIHITYLREGKVYYALRPAGASKWFSRMVIDSTHATSNIWPRVAADREGKPHICVSFGMLMYVTLAEHKWVTQHVDPGSGTISYHCSIAVGSNGVPHVGWYHEFLPGGAQYMGTWRMARGSSETLMAALQVNGIRWRSTRKAFHMLPLPSWRRVAT